MNPADGVAERFACELRALRAAAGELPFWKMARRCDVSKSALAAAVAGYELPSERVMLAYVRACGGDADWWSERLTQARSQSEAERAARILAPGASASTELVLVRHTPPPVPVPVPVPVQAMTHAPPLAPRTLFLPGQSRTRVNRRMAALALTGVTVLIAVAVSTILLQRHPAASASATTPPSLRGAAAYDQTVGPGCPHTALAKVTQDDFTEAHKWTQSTATTWNVPGCSNLILYSLPTTSSNPDRWQDDYEWYFDNVPKNTPCTFHIYIPDSPNATYAATYDWTAGDSNYLDSTAFVVDQATYRGQWYDHGPYTFPTGQAMMMITDARSSSAPTAPLAATAVRLTCK